MAEQQIDANVCIVGSGVSGGIIAKELLAAGIDGVLIVEMGQAVDPRTRRAWYDQVTRDGYSYKNPSSPLWPHLVQPTEIVNAGKDPFTICQLNVRGGTTVHWEGYADRLKPEDFRLFSNTGKRADWPISYEVLEPFYADAERTLRVAGDHDDPGPPRSKPYPLPAVPIEAVEGPFVDAMKRMGHELSHLPIARNTQPIDGHNQCLGIGTCVACPQSGRFTGDLLMTELEKNDRFRLQLGFTALAFEADSSGAKQVKRLRGTIGGQRVDISAAAFVVCCGGVASAKLLLNSRSPRWPKGLGNNRGHVGKHYVNHLMAIVYGSIPNPSGQLKSLPYPTVYSRAFDTSQRQAEGKWTLFPDYFGPSLEKLMLSGRAADDINKALAGEIECSLRACIESLNPDNSMDNEAATNELELPRTRARFSFSEGDLKAVDAAKQQMSAILKEMGAGEVVTSLPPFLYAHDTGTCRMSAAEDAGVVDPNLRVHGLDNLYVCGSSVFPNISAAHPTLAIAAMAHRLGRHLSGQLN